MSEKTKTTLAGLDENEVQTIRDTPLTPKEMRKLFIRYQANGAIGFENIYYQGKSWPWILKLFFKWFYNKKGYAEGMSRHFDLYNTEPMTGSLIFGIVLGLEERKALHKDVDSEMIRSLKVGLQGPIAGIGDSIVQATLIPILITLCLSISSESGSPLGPILYIVLLCAILFPYSYFLFKKGYQMGSTALDLLSQSVLSKVTKAISVFGLTLIGSLAAQRVNAKIALSFMSDGQAVSIQSILDGVFPNIISLLVIFFLYWLMKRKKISSTWIIYGMMVVVMILSLIGIV